MSRFASSESRQMLLVANQHGLCCVALLSWIRYKGYDVAQLQDLTREQCRAITTEIRNHFDPNV
jgi:hypothetical protein